MGDGMRNRMRGRGGFTLIEILIVISIVGIMATLASTNVMSWMDHTSAVGFQRELLGRCADARTRAMSSNLQHRLRIDLAGETVTLQRGNAGTGSSAWSPIGNDIVGSRGAGVQKIAYDNGTEILASTYHFIFNPGGQVLAQDNSSNIHPITRAKIRLAADKTADRGTILLYGHTSKARLENGWN